MQKDLGMTFSNDYIKVLQRAGCYMLAVYLGCFHLVANSQKMHKGNAHLIKNVLYSCIRGWQSGLQVRSGPPTCFWK